MSTPYADVFDAYLSSLGGNTEYSKMSDGLIKVDMLKLLKSSILEFEFPRVNLKDRDDTLEVFNNDLDEDTVQLLSMIMKSKWLDRQIFSLSLLKQQFSSDKEFRMTSQANHLDSLLSLKAYESKELEQLKTDYSYRTSDNKTKFDRLGDDFI